MCESKEWVVGYLYDDIGDDERRAFEAHMAVCGDCRDELIALRATRQHLSLWSPPARDLGFRVVRDDAVAQPARVLPMRSRWTAAFGLAAAAVLVLAAATAIANLEIRYDANGLVVSFERSGRSGGAVRECRARLRRHERRCCAAQGAFD